MEKDQLKEIVDWYEETIRFYRPGNQWELDSWVVKSFLTNLGEKFEETELVQPVQEPPDVQFRTANFEIKELLNPGRRRHQEYKYLLEQAKSGTSIEELGTGYRQRSIKLSELLVYLQQIGKKYAARYSKGVMAALDLLIYVNLKGAHGLEKDCSLKSPVLESQEWRSVSFVKGIEAGVICAQEGAPELIRKQTHKIVYRTNFENGI